MTAEIESLPAAACVPLALQRPRPKLLDLFCCAGGAAMGYHRAGFDVTGVDIKPQPRYPFRFIQGDALEYAEAHGHEFDAIHASPPCQEYTIAGRNERARGKKYADLVAPTRELLNRIGRPWSMENVPGAPMRPDFVLCGSQFGLPIVRHRLFELSESVFQLMAPCSHDPAALTICGHGTPSWMRHKRIKMGLHPNASVAMKKAAMGIDWMNREELSQAIPPAYTEFIGREVMRVVLQGDRLGAAAGKSECLLADAGGESR